MNFKQLEAFQAIMASGSTVGAAERLRLSQSAISRLLSQFEEDLGLRLFVREKGRLLPTHEAEALLQDVHGLMDSAQCFRRHSEQLRVGGFKRHLLKVAVPTTMATALMPSVAQRFMQTYPDVVLEVLTGTYRDSERAVLAHEADIGIVRLPTEMQGLHTTVRIESDAVCIMPKGHALEQLDEIHPIDLAESQLILLGRQRQIRQEIDQAFRQSRVRPRITMEVHSVHVACAHVAQGIGVSIVNALLADYCQPETFSTRPFRPRIAYELGVATLEDATQTPLNKTFSDLLIEAILKGSHLQGHTRMLRHAG